MSIQPVTPLLDQQAVGALKDAYKAYGEHPDEEQLFLINTIITTYIGQPLSCAKITEAMATCYDIAHVTEDASFKYHGQYVEPGDELYDDAKADYLADKHNTLHRIIQESSKE